MPCAPGKPCIGDDAKAIVLDFVNPARARPAAFLLAAGGRARIGEGTARRERGAATHSLLTSPPQNNGRAVRVEPIHKNKPPEQSTLGVQVVHVTWLTSLLADLARRGAALATHGPTCCCTAPAGWLGARTPSPHQHLCRRHLSGGLTSVHFQYPLDQLDIRRLGGGCRRRVGPPAELESSGRVPAPSVQ
jgi:hypothetical protein